MKVAELVELADWAEARRKAARCPRSETGKPLTQREQVTAAPAAEVPAEHSQDSRRGNGRERALLIVLGLLVACGGESQVGPSSIPTAPPQVQPATATASAFWPISAGRRWTFRNAASGALTTIEATGDGNSLLFTKSDVETYWGSGWNTSLLWGIEVAPDGIYAGDPRGSWREVDEYPDDVRIDRQTGRIEERIWYLTADGQKPYLLMPSTIQVPSEHHGLQKYYFTWRTGRRWGCNVPWNVAYRWDGDLLRLLFDEPLCNGTTIHEDWYFERGYGPVRIEQWHDPARTALKLRIER